MPVTGFSPRSKNRIDVLALPIGTSFGYAIAFLAVLVVALISWRSMAERATTADKVSQSMQVIAQAQGLLSAMKDAETGQRGFLLTGAERYVVPYTQARANLPAILNNLRNIAADNPPQLSRVTTLMSLASEKVNELGETVALRRAGKTDEAIAIVNTDRGKGAMDRIRTVVDEMVRSEEALLQQRQDDWQQAVRTSAWVTLGGAAVLAALIALAALVAARDHRAQRREAWIRTGQIGIGNVIAGEQLLEVQGGRVLDFLADYLGARVGAFFVTDDTGTFRRTAGYALDAAAAERVGPGTNLLGQAAVLDKPLRVDAVPPGYLPVSSALGSATPTTLLIAPASTEGVVHAVVELGFFGNVDVDDEAFLLRISDTLGLAVRAAKDRHRMQELLEETQIQAEELQTQEEELRVGNEELEEQSRALKESAAQLESQQTELEQTNSQLEMQADLAARQNDALTAAQAALHEHAAALERSNQVKGEFLANMSHELRTPLNSTLILAKLLADNKGGNLSDEQVKFAETISSAGNDLLALINDILDLSKLEAGKVDVDPETVVISRTLDALRRTFDPMAAQRRLRFVAEIDAGAPQTIVTDDQRLVQILRNLIANALKFTERGEVSVHVSAPSESTVAFAVRDTGVGIEEPHQEMIFEAFRQADGSTHRKYGGTGLGLSISRDLAHLLGGDIALESTRGVGSVFTLTLPRAYVAPEEDDSGPVSAAVSAAVSATVSAATPALAPAMPRGPANGSPRTTDPARPATTLRPAPPRAAPSAPFQRRVSDASLAADTDDDRANLRSDSRCILVIEDDTRFADILRDLCREKGFQCIVTHSAAEGVDAAALFRPSAILLDMNLPDGSGLSVLDRLKSDANTRHIPVHVASVADYSREALERGAIGYALKPVKRDDLVDVLNQLEAKFTQKLRHVLVVEDDARQLESITRLLANEEVRIVGVATGIEALERLQRSTFDCMVMDLNLPDLSGYELLERMAGRDGVSFPPVIVYTGRSLTRDEEQKLRRYSKSIIVKDARSPERLLDEVTLFLHQVEAKLPPERQRMLREARNREATLEGRRILVVEDDVRNIFALSSVLEPKGAVVAIARNGREAIEAVEASAAPGAAPIDLVLMDIMMPEMDGYAAMREIRSDARWDKLPIIALTAKAMKDDQEKCLAAGANDYIAKPLDVEKLLSLVRVWMPK